MVWIRAELFSEAVDETKVSGLDGFDDRLQVIHVEKHYGPDRGVLLRDELPDPVLKPLDQQARCQPEAKDWFQNDNHGPNAPDITHGQSGQFPTAWQSEGQAYVLRQLLYS